MTMTDSLVAALGGLIVIATTVLVVLVRSGKRIGPDDRSLRINQDAWRQLDALAKELSKSNNQKTVHDLIVEGITLVLQKYGKPPVP